MSLVKANRSEAPDGNYRIGPYNLTKAQVDKMIIGGSHKTAEFEYSLADTTAVATPYTDGDVLVELGTLDLTPIIYNRVITRVLITNVYHKVVVAAAQTLVGTIQVSATTGTATNAAIDTGTEIVGAGATYLDSSIGTEITITEADINLNGNAGTVTIAKPHINFASTLKYVYLCATTPVNADITAGRGFVTFEYIVL